MPRYFFSFVFFVLSGVFSSAEAARLMPGDPAPGISIRTWYKGAPLRALPAKGFAIVEFWATWCVPCRDSIPDLTKLSKANPDVAVLGVGIWEDDDGKNVRKFVTDMGSRMNYRVGYSGNETGMAATWMGAAGATAIPTSFLVKDRRIVWIGHPDGLAPALAEARAGTLNVAKHRAAWGAEAHQAAYLRQLAAVEARVEQTYQRTGVSAAIAELKRARNQFPNSQQDIDDMEIAYLAELDWDAWTALVEKAAPRGRVQTRSAFLTAVWRHIKNPKRRDFLIRVLDFGLQTVGPKDFFFLFFAARVYDEAQMPKDGLRLLDLADQCVPKGESEDTYRKMVINLRTKLMSQSERGK